MNKLLAYAIMGIGVALLLPAIAACGADLTPLEQRVSTLEGNISQMAPVAAVKEFRLTGVEWKGTTSADKLEPPTVNPKTLSAGYGFSGPGFDTGNPKNWQVAAYVWTPGAMVVNQGDTVDLTAFIVNGDHHDSRIIAPDGSQVGATMVLNRGREYKFSFEAAQSGVYKLICDTHAPSMTATITVLPTT